MDLKQMILLSPTVLCQVVYMFLWLVIQLENMGGAGVLHVIFGKLLTKAVGFKVCLKNITIL